MKNSFAIFVFASLLSAACGQPAPANSTANSPGNKPAANVASNSNANSSAPVNTTSSGAKPFSKTVENLGIKFEVSSPNSATGNTVTVKPSGLQGDNSEQKQEVDGEVEAAFADDVNADNSPEVYVVVRDPKTKKGSIVAYSANNKKSLSDISIAEPAAKDLAGYNGGDEFEIVEGTFVRRFEVYEGTGADARKTGKTRQFQYKLKAGEAAWQLVQDKVMTF